MRRSAREIAEALGGAVRLAEGSYKCRCPSHDDRGQDSFSVTEKDGKLLVRCFKECTQEQVVEALRERDLWPRSERRGGGSQSKASWEQVSPVPDDAPRPSGVTHHRLGKPARHWIYRDQDGKLVGYVFRFEEVVAGKVKKTPMPMSWCRSDDGKHEWRWKSFDKPRPLYGLDRLARRSGDPVLVVEGEKSCDAATELFPGHVCVSWPGGTKAAKYVDLKPLAGRDVTLWPDADKVGRDAMVQVAEVLFVEGASRVRVVQVPEWVDSLSYDVDGRTLSGEGWDVADDPVPGLPPLADLLSGARDFAPEGGDVVETLNRRYAFVLVGGKSAVLRETRDEETKRVEVTYLAPESFAQFHSNSRVPVGRATIPAGKYWLTHEARRTYEGVTFSPGRDLRGYYNLWRGFAYEPDPRGDWSLLRRHLLENAAQGNEEHYRWILGWFASMVQTPAKKTGTSLCFRGKQGTGKTIVGQLFGKLMPAHYTLVEDSRYMFDRFNSHMASTILLHCDESFWGGDPRHVGKIRAMVTGETHRIENKRVDSIEVPNFMRLLISTNEEVVVPAGPEERRFAVFDMGEGNMQDRKFFVEMRRQMRDGGYAGFMHALATMDLTEVDVGKIPETRALRDQKESSLTDTGKFWLYCLMEGEVLPGTGNGWPDDLRYHSIYEALVTYLQNVGAKYRPTPTQFRRDLERMVPPGSLQDIKKNLSGSMQWCVTLPGLEPARRYFDNLFGSEFPWKRLPSEVRASVEPDIPF